MNYVIDENADEPIMCIFTHIGMDDDDGMGVDGGLFARELLTLDTAGKKSIQVYINCPGGNVLEGMSIFNAILKSKTPVDTHNVGIAASMGGVIFMAGRKRIMSDYASLMVHNPNGSDDKGAIASMTDSLSTMLSAKSGLTKEDVAYLMKKETWMNSAECFAKGFCTEIAVTSEHNKKRMESVKNPTPGGAEIENPTPGGGTLRAMWKEAKNISNNLFNNNNTSMKKVTAKLKLVDGANEDQVLAGIESMEANHSSAMDFLRNSETELKNKLAGIENKMPGLTSTVKKVTAKLGLNEDATEAEIETALDKVVTDAAGAETAKAAQLKTNAEGLVNSAVKAGRIANKKDTVDGWVKLAISDFDGTKKMIEDLPLNKAAASITDKFENEGKEDTLRFGATAAGVMLQVQNKLTKK